MQDISIIIPVAPNDDAWRNLIDTLPHRDKFAEIILVGHSLPSNGLEQNIIYISSRKNGRASNMNYAASVAKSKFLWFVHADSHISETAIHALVESTNTYPNRLHYFNLQFSEYPIMKLNSWGVKFRSDILKCPFGDQAFCVAAELFHKIGGYDESAIYGEDHLLVWQARCNGIKLHNVGAYIVTSARKYQKNGWLKTTLNHVWLWATQVCAITINKDR